MSDPSTTAGAIRLKSPIGRWVLTATVLGSGLSQLGGSIVNVALPAIGRDLDVGLSTLQWTLNAYSLTLAGFLLLGGSLGDERGRRRYFTIGIYVFVIASIICALAPTGGVLIAARALQGVGAAFLTPSSLAIIEAVFIDDDRGAAVGSWSALGGIAAAIGPVAGGAIVSAADWGWRLTFLLNVPLAIATLYAARRIPETKDDDADSRVDVSGAVLAAVGLASLMYGLTLGPATAWSAAPLATVGVGVVSLVAFVVNEHRARQPLMPLSLFRSRQFSAANAVTFVVYAALSGALFLLPLQLQVVSGFSATLSGATLLPVTIIMMLLSSYVGRLSTRTGPRVWMSVGPIVAGGGLMLLVRVGSGASFVVDVLPAVAIFGVGLALTVAPLTSTALSAAPSHEVGVASAINNDVSRVAGLFAVAVLPMVVGIDQAAYSDPESFSGGFHRAVLVAGLFCALGGVLSAFTIQNRSTTDVHPAVDQAATSTYTPDLMPTPTHRRWHGRSGLPT